MSIRVYNTLTRKKEEFIPLVAGNVSLYVCGVTPYNHPHIGNARPPVVWDVIRRYFEYCGYKVKHVQNFTDVDDKIIMTAQNEAIDWQTLAQRYIDEYMLMTDQLAILPADVYPKVSEHMPEIIAMIEELIAKQHAYAVDGDVYYSVESFDSYGKLSGRDLSDMQAGARVDIDERKRHPMDFALWKAAKPGEPFWSSPWGDGRPGWHIECSAMSIKYLGQQFDMHGGGSDLIFPHHENEIAQSEGFTGLAPFVKYWLHNGFVTINEEKMSKSLGNFFLVKDILQQFPAEVLRFLIISAHYRSPLDFSDERMQEAERSLQRLQKAFAALEWLLGQVVDNGQPIEELLAVAANSEQRFKAAMDDDFNTALAIAELFALAKAINTQVAAVKSQGLKVSKQEVQQVSSIFRAMAQVLGILQQPMAAEAGDNKLLNGLMDIIMEIRQKSRQSKDFTTADWLRQRLTDCGVIIEDGKQGSSWRRQD